MKQAAMTPCDSEAAKKNLRNFFSTLLSLGSEEMSVQKAEVSNPVLIKSI